MEGLVKVFHSSFPAYSTIALPYGYFILLVKSMPSPLIFILGFTASLASAMLLTLSLDKTKEFSSDISQSIEGSIQTSKQSYVASRLPNLIDRWLRVAMQPLSKIERQNLLGQKAISSTILLAHAARDVKKENRLLVVTQQI